MRPADSIGVTGRKAAAGKSFARRSPCGGNHEVGVGRNSKDLPKIETKDRFRSVPAENASRLGEEIPDRRGVISTEVSVEWLMGIIP